jgi:DNA mismatch repair ATPase MutS
MKARLLFPDADFDFAGPPPPNHEDLVADLELDTLLDAMARGDKFLRQVARSVLLASLSDPEAVRYRQRVLADCISEPELIRDMYRITVEALAAKRKVWGYFSASSPGSTLSAAVNQLEVLLAWLRELRAVADHHAGKFRSEGLATLLLGLQRNLDDEYLATLAAHLKQLRFRGGELMSAELARDNSGINYVLRAGPTRRGLKEMVGLAPKSVYSFTIAPRDDAGAQAIEAMSNRALNLVANAAAQSADHVSSYFAMLSAELGFYVSCLNLHEQLAAAGQPLTFPDPRPSQSRELAGTDLRDACLWLRTPRVTGNDFDADGKSLVIITGANSGGKSTFLRSVGVACLMTLSGLFVTATSFKASAYAGVFTHFIREEDPNMVSGRLDEELKRLSSMADQLKPHSLILFNESFAATNEREGSEIARQITDALLEAGLTVCFVTHQFDLADSYHRRNLDTALFLRAPRQPDGHRSYQLTVAGPLPTSYGGDIYLRIGGWLGEGRPDSQ